MDSIAQVLQDFGVVMLNGVLAVLYFVVENGATLLSLAAAGLVMAWPDRSVQIVAGHRPRSHQRGRVVRATPVAMIATAAVAACWPAASLLSHEPVPLWGLLMWLALLAGTLALPQERENVLWTHKGLILGYAALAVGLRLLFEAPVDTVGWSELMGIEQGGTALLATVRSALAPWAAITGWAIYPVAYLGRLG